MDAVTNEIVGAVKDQILMLIGVAGVAAASWLRSRFQSKVFEEEVRTEERKALRQTSAGGPKVPGEVKHAAVVERANARLPWHAKTIPIPVIGGADRLVKKNVEKLKRESLPPEAG